MLQHLSWPTLEHRRNLSRLTMLYKITHNLVSIDPNLYLTPQPSISTRKTSPLHYQLYSTRTDYFKYSFFPHTVTLWNTLPHAVLAANTLDQFKSGPKLHTLATQHSLYILFLLAHLLYSLHFL